MLNILGEYYSLTKSSWSQYPASPVFTVAIATLNSRVAIIGQAKQNGTCQNQICSGNTIFGDNTIMEFDLEKRLWKERHNMLYPKLAYFSSIEIPNSYMNITTAERSLLELTTTITSYPVTAIPETTTSAAKATNKANTTTATNTTTSTTATTSKTTITTTASTTTTTTTTTSTKSTTTAITTTATSTTLSTTTTTTSITSSKLTTKTSTTSQATTSSPSYVTTVTNDKSTAGMRQIKIIKKDSEANYKSCVCCNFVYILIFILSLLIHKFL